MLLAIDTEKANVYFILYIVYRMRKKEGRG